MIGRSHCGAAVWLAVLTLGTTGRAARDSNAPFSAAELVKAVRQSENWIHEVGSFYVRIESTWTHPPETIAARRIQLQSRYPDEALDPNKWPELRPQSQDRLEIAFDKERLRYLHDDPGASLMLRIWDGKQATSHEKYERFAQEHYYRANKPEQIFRGLFDDLSWLRTQPHAFWWWPDEIDPELELFGRPEHFQLTGREAFRDVDCHVLEYETRGRSVGVTVRWHVGVADHRLYGVGTGHDGQISIQHWLGAYQELASGCWFPMSQGYAIYEPNDSGRLTLEMRRDLKMVEIRINEPLADGLFRIEIKPGVKVSEEWFGETRTYTHVPNLVGKALPGFDGIKLDTEPQALSGKALLVCFWDPSQRPSRHCLRLLADQARQLGERGITVLAIQAGPADSQPADQSPGGLADFCRRGVIESDIEKVKFTWGVRSLPWLALADREHIVRASGFSPAELGDQVSKMIAGQAEPASATRGISED